ncbi:tetratricopeptide repeat protein [Benzoatithermus flavus]|uniref:Tetratricopeptide repeat protein n=1 Tax=Benzoatithermus flavus TaxID=3108223 RepID=A0ABU8XRH6_9PROT
MKSEEFIREVDEELQREQLAKLWHRYGGLVVGLAVLVVVGTAAKVGWDHWRQQAMAEEALRFHAAEQALTAKPAEAAEQFAALAAQGDTGYAALARLKEAQARITLKDQVAAKKALEELATSGTGDAVLRDLGTLLAASHELDTADPGDLARRLEPLAQDDAPWRYRARELLALLAIRTGDLDRARKLLEPLSREVGVPQTQQRRAQELLDAIGGATQQASS